MKNQSTPHSTGPFIAHGCAIYQADNWQNGNNLGGKLIATTATNSPDDDSLPTDQQIEDARWLAQVATMARHDDGRRCLVCNGLGGHEEGCPGESAYVTLQATLTEVTTALQTAVDSMLANDWTDDLPEIISARAAIAKSTAA